MSRAGVNRNGCGAAYGVKVFLCHRVVYGIAACVLVYRAFCERAVIFGLTVKDLTVSSVSGKSDLDSVGLSVVDSCISGCVNACDRGIFDLDFKAAGYGIMVCCGCSVIYRIDAGVGEGRSIFLMPAFRLRPVLL